MQRILLTFSLLLLCALTAWSQGASSYRTEDEGIDNPVLLTTDAANPVLYRIQCAGTGKYIKAGNYRQQGWGGGSNTYGLCLTDRIDDATDFYFLKSQGGVQILTADGYYADTALSDGYYSGIVRLTKGTPAASSEPWLMEYNNKDQARGYMLYFSQLSKFENYEYTEEFYWSYNSRDYVSYGWGGEAATFLFYSADKRHHDHLAANGIDGSNAPKGFLGDFVGDITLDGRPLVYDSASQTYFFSLPLAARGGGDYAGTCLFDATEAGYSLAVGEQTLQPGGTLSLPAVSCNRPYTIAVRAADGSTLMRAKLNFTFLPTVEIKASYVDRENYNIGTLRVSYDPALDDDDDESGNGQLLEADFKYRGATASGLQKKSYAVKLRDKKDVSYDRKFFGLRNDNNWILDAAGIDPTLMRNRVATDLWNDYSHKPYYKSLVKNERTGTRGRFVEVFLNGEYLGLYCMTEKLDRKQVKALKQEKAPDGSTIQHGSVYKSTEWKYEVFMGHELDDHTYPRTAPADYTEANELCLEKWRGWEIKYPDYEKEIIDWGPLYNCVNFTATQGGTKFSQGFDTYWDMDQVKDYYLLLDLLLATDNHGKNMVLINYDQQAEVDAQRMAIGVWDLDGTFGIRWNGSTYLTGPDQDFESFLWANEHGTHVLFYRLKSSKQYDWKAILRRRYAKLRHTYFDPEQLKQRFTDYLDLFTESGADLREEKKWGRVGFYYAYHDDIAGAVSYATDWIDRRIAYLDEQYAYDPSVDPDDMPDGLPNGIERIDSDPAVPTIALRSGVGSISVLADAPTTLVLYNAAGQQVLSQPVAAGVTTIAPLAAGIYVAGGQKVVVK